jgi:hypothetical protein
VAGLLELAELLDVDMDQFARVFALVAAYRLCWFEIAQPVPAQPPQDPTYRRRTDAEFGGDLLAGASDSIRAYASWLP